MNESFITRDIPFLEQNKLQSEMSKYIEQIHSISGYYKQPNYYQRISKKEFQKSEVLIPNFEVLSRKFEDHTKQIEDEVIREWMEKMAFEEKYNPSNTVPMDHIMRFLKKMADNFNNMIQFQQMPSDEQRENKRKMSTFEKDFMLKQIDDSKVTITFFTTLISQVNQIMDCEQIVHGKNKEFIQNLLDKYLEIVQVSSEEIVQNGQKLLQEDQNQILNKGVKNTLIQRLLDIEQTFINYDKINFTTHTSNQPNNKKQYNQFHLQNSPSTIPNQMPNQDIYKSSQYYLKTGQSSQNQYKNHMDLSLTSSHKETEYLDFYIKDFYYGERDDGKKELINKFQVLMNRLRKMSEVIKITQTEKVHEMVEMINELKTVLFLHNLVLKNQIESHLKIEENLNLFEKRELKNKIEEYRKLILKCFKYVEDQKKTSINDEKPSFKRYMGDQGMITHRHFILNKDNLVPIFKHLDPSRFIPDQAIKKSDIYMKQEEQLQKHVLRIQKTNHSLSIYSQPTVNTKRKDTLKSNEVSMLCRIKSRQNSIWSKLDENTQNSGVSQMNRLHHQQTNRVSEEGHQRLSSEGGKGQNEKRNSHSGMGQTRTKMDQSKILANILKQNNQKKKGLQEYELQKNSKVLQQNITSLINNSFDEDRVNEQILNKDEESKQKLKSQNMLPQILLNMRNTLNSNQFNLSKCDENSMAEQSQENLSSSMNEFSIEDMSPNSHINKQNEEILIDIGDQQITPIKPNQRIRGLNSKKSEKRNNNSFHLQSNYTRSSSIEIGGNSVDYYSIKGYDSKIKRPYYSNNRNESYDEYQDGSTLFNSQISPLKSQEQSIDLGVMKKDLQMSQKSSLTCNTQGLEDMVQRRQKQRLHINRMQMPNTLPIMTSIAAQKQHQEEEELKLKQVKRKDRSTSKNQKQQLPNLINTSMNNIEIHVQEHQAGDTSPPNDHQLQLLQQSLKIQTNNLKESINFYDTMYQYKLKVEREEELKQQRLTKRQKVIDNVNANFMPKYFHINGGKLAQRANPQLIRHLVSTSRKEELERNQYVQENYKKLKKRENNNYYGIEELTCPPKEHQFITSSIFNTYDDIKTDYILSQKPTN